MARVPLIPPPGCNHDRYHDGWENCDTCTTNPYVVLDAPPAASISPRFGVSHAVIITVTRAFGRDD